MVCPLRFVLAGLSAAIVLFLAIDLLWGSGKDNLLHAGEVRNCFRTGRSGSSAHKHCVRLSSLELPFTRLASHIRAGDYLYTNALNSNVICAVISPLSFLWRRYRLAVISTAFHGLLRTEQLFRSKQHDTCTTSNHRMQVSNEMRLKFAGHPR
jgi:hypothetical protein